MRLSRSSGTVGAGVTFGGRIVVIWTTLIRWSVVDIVRLSRSSGRVGAGVAFGERTVLVWTTLIRGAQCAGSAAASRNTSGVLLCIVVVYV